MFYLIQALYQEWTGYTGTSLFESTSLTVFNTLFTSLCVIFLGIFEQDLNASTLLAVPELYTQGQRNLGFNIKKYLAWMFLAASEAVIIYFCMYGLFGGVPTFTEDDSLLSMGQLCFSAAVVFINTKMLILEMHNKTLITALGWVISVGGWFMWNILLSLIMKIKGNKNYLLYPVAKGFLHQFGTNLLWWLVLILTLAALIVLELGVSSVRKAFWPTDTDVFQEFQKDKFIKKRFEDTAGGEGEVEMGREGKSSVDAEREGEIQELLERPRVMDEGLLKSPVEPERTASGRSLTRRKFSVDVERGMGSGAVSPKTRHSVDIAEVLGRR
jgi:phospholipid-translocating ATPase